MYKQSKLQGHASYTALKTQEGDTDGHLAVKRYSNTGQLSGTEHQQAISLFISVPHVIDTDF